MSACTAVALRPYSPMRRTVSFRSSGVAGLALEAGLTKPQMSSATTSAPVTTATLPVSTEPRPGLIGPAPFGGAADDHVTAGEAAEGLGWTGSDMLRSSACWPVEQARRRRVASPHVAGKEQRRARQCTGGQDRERASAEAEHRH